MKKYRFVLTIPILLLLLSLCGCFGDPPSYSYQGSDVDLNSIAANSILGIYGVSHNKIAVAQKDSYGRRMFVYWGSSVAANDQIYSDKPSYIISILIVQKSDEEYAYYYPDFNFVVYKDEARKYSPSEQDLQQYVSNPAISVDIEWLKQRNDWDNPIDEGKCVKVSISRANREDTSKSPLVREETKKNAYKQVAAQDYFSPDLFFYLTSDDYDRHIYFFRIVEKNDEIYSDSKYKNSYVVMFNKDGSYNPQTGIMEITDLWHYQEQLHTFKDMNGWNTPVF